MRPYAVLRFVSLAAKSGILVLPRITAPAARSFAMIVASRGENHLRTQPPWNGAGLACGMEFGVSPFVESRRAMVNRGTLFGVPTFRWLPALSRVSVDYCAFLALRDRIPERIQWDGDR